MLSLYASGLISSEDVSQSVPVDKGNALPKARVRLNLAGYEFTDYLMEILTGRVYCFTTIAEREIIFDIKVQLCYLTRDLEQETSTATGSPFLEKSCKLPTARSSPSTTGGSGALRHSSLAS